MTLSEVTRLWGSPIVDTTATFSDGGTIYDFRGYTFDATDALGVAVWTAEVLGDGSTVLKLYYTSNTDTDYVLEHYLVTGAGTIKGDGPIYVEHLEGLTDTMIVLADKEHSQALYTDPTTGKVYDFRGYVFRPRSDGPYRLVNGKYVQTDADATILGSGERVLKLYYLAQTVHLQLELGTADNDPADGVTDAHWLNAGRDISGNKLADSIITLPTADAAIRPGYELVGWYISDLGSNEEGRRSVEIANEIMGYHQLDTTGANNVFVPVGASYTVPQIGATLYAVWRAKEIEYEVERWQIVGSNIAAVKIDTVIRTGYTGDFAHGSFDGNDETVPLGYHLMGTDRPTRRASPSRASPTRTSTPSMA